MSAPIKEKKGQCRSIWWADPQAKKSFNESLSHCKSDKADSLRARVEALIEKLADYHLGTRRGLQKVNFPEEGPLPGKPGMPKGKYRAIKKIPVRLYGWFYESEGHPQISKGDFVIAHCVHKDYQNKKKEMDNKVGNKWTKLEVSK